MLKGVRKVEQNYRKIIGKVEQNYLIIFSTTALISGGGTAFPI
jgi:hypothetical protein